MKNLFRVTALVALAVLVALGMTRATSAPPARAVALAGPVPWADSLALGMPTAPQRWDGTSPNANYDIQIHGRYSYSAALGDGTEPFNADHGADCGAPPATHPVSTGLDTVFICHDHVMLGNLDQGYGESVLTPDELADWSGGATTIKFSMSTVHMSLRDWMTVTVTPFTKQLALPFDFGVVDLHGMPSQFVQAKFDTQNGYGKWSIEQDGGTYGEDELGQQWPYFDDYADGFPACFTDSKSIRTPFDFTFDAHSYSFSIDPSAGCAGGMVLTSGAWDHTVPFTQGVVQFGFHAYNSEKCAEGYTQDNPAPGPCYPDSWHLSNLGISSAVPYFLERPLAGVRSISSDVASGTLTFATAAPAASYLKFASIGATQYSLDGGATWLAATMAPQDPSIATADEHAQNYLQPIPAGTTSVMVKVAGGWFGSGLARDFSIISLNGAGAPPPPTPTPTPTAPPTPTPTATPTPTPPPAPAPTITSFTPTHGVPPTGITITGTGFTGATGAMVGSTALTNFTVVSSTSITATVPVGAASGAVMVMSPNGNATGGTFTVDVAGGQTLAGDTAIEAVQDYDPAGTADVFQYVAGASGTATKVHVYIDGGNTATSVKIGVYSTGANGQPNALLATATLTGPTKSAWNVATLSAGVGIVSGTKYWITLLSPPGAGDVYYRDKYPSGTTTYTSCASNLTAPPATWSSCGSWGASPASMYLGT